MSDQNERASGPAKSVRVPVRADFAGGWSDVTDFAAREGGAVLNAAIEPYIEGHARWQDGRMQLEYSLDLPSDSHLGTSSALDLTWLRLTFALIGKQVGPRELVEKTYQIEKSLGVKAGKQDQIASALGGFNFTRFHGEDQAPAIEPLHLAPELEGELQNRCVLCYSGPSRASSDEHKEVWRRYREGDEKIAAALRTLRDSAAPARNALMSGDFDELARLATLNRETVRRLHPGLVTPRMDELFEAARRAGAPGGKGCGAGGGGYLLLLCDAGQKAAVEDALREHGGTILSVAFAPRTD